VEYVTRLPSQGSDGLPGIHGTAPAETKDHLRAHFPRKGRTTAGVIDGRFRWDAESLAAQACGGQTFFHRRCPLRLGSSDDEDALPHFAAKLRQTMGGAAAENDAGGSGKFKGRHGLDASDGGI
jgi:hypothetical protein